MKIISVLLIVLALPAIHCLGQHITPLPLKDVLYTKPVHSTLAKLMQLQPQEFIYIRREEPSQPKTSYGFLTADIEREYPQLITHQVMPLTKQVGKSQVPKQTTVKRVNYQQLLPLLIAAIQEQQALIEQQQAQLEQLSKQVQLGK
jgi:hypothetical protein